MSRARRAALHGLAAAGAIGALPVGLVALALRPAWRPGLRERLGSVRSRSVRPLWVHGASVGEALAALPLIDGLVAAGHPVQASVVTPTGREVLGRARPELPLVFAPLDHPWCVERALARVNPRALLLIETELWPSWIKGAARRNVPTAVVSGRISDRSLAGYRRLGRFVRRSLAHLAAVGARSGLDAERFIELGVPRERVCVTGDLKLAAPKRRPPVAEELEACLYGAAAPLLVAGSTHPGEEAAALGALDALEAAGLEASLVLAPRHLDRVPDVEREVVERGRPCRRRSSGGPKALAPGEVLVLDTLGELAGVYGAARLAFVGGTLGTDARKVGGHNPLEPIFADPPAPLVFGPHTQNIRVAADLLERCGAATRVADAAALQRVVVDALRAPAERERARAAAGRKALAEHEGAVERTIGLVESLLADAT